MFDTFDHFAEFVRISPVDRCHSGYHFIHSFEKIFSPFESEARSKGLDEKFCQECGSIIRAKAEICPKCGVRQGGESSSERNRMAAALFALILGGIGIHKFYLGKVGQGVLYVLFCWTFIPFIIP